MISVVILTQDTNTEIAAFYYQFSSNCSGDIFFGAIGTLNQCVKIDETSQGVYYGIKKKDNEYRYADNCANPECTNCYYDYTG